MSTRKRNECRDYELSSMRFVVVEPINGRTDWYTRAAFQFEGDAKEYAAANTPDNLRAGDYPLEVREIGVEVTS